MRRRLCGRALAQNWDQLLASNLLFYFSAAGRLILKPLDFLQFYTSLHLVMNGQGRLSRAFSKILAFCPSRRRDCGFSLGIRRAFMHHPNLILGRAGFMHARYFHKMLLFNKLCAVKSINITLHHKIREISDDHLLSPAMTAVTVRLCPALSVSVMTTLPGPFGVKIPPSAG